jgi:hypothetical protein
VKFQAAKSKGITWLVGLAVCFGCFGIAQAEESADARLVAEAKLLLRAVLTDEPPAQQCELKATWQNYPIPESVAREHFGLRAHAELSGQSFGPSLTDILDPAPDRELVCDEDRAKSVEDEQLRQYKASDDTQPFIFRRTWYTFPVFSDDYKSAALVVSHIGLGWARMSDGIKSLPAGVVGYVAIYKKIEGDWRRVTTVELFIS